MTLAMAFWIGLIAIASTVWLYVVARVITRAVMRTLSEKKRGER